MYRNLRRPPLDPAGLRRSLATGRNAPWARLDVVGETGSTNADLVAAVAAAAQPASLDRTVLLAEQQSAGKGRGDRAFVCAPQSQILLSAALRLPGVPPQMLGWMPLLAGLAVAETLRDVAEVDAGLKWPNDVLVGDPEAKVSEAKVSGILTEMALPPSAAGGAAMIVVGIGVNVGQTRAELPVDTATSLELAGAACTDRNTLVRALLRRLATRVHRWQAMRGRDDGLADDYARLSRTIGREVRAVLPGGGELRGPARGIDGEGRLLIAAGRDAGTPDGHTGAGSLTPVAAGDIVHLRPVGGAGA